MPTLREEMKQILSNKIDKSQLKPGDHIYSWRTDWLYAHHGIFFLFIYFISIAIVISLLLGFFFHLNNDYHLFAYGYFSSRFV
ncbi:hypothetical protein Hanom_Chr14g01290221 [Helianthus anomalus]